MTDVLALPLTKSSASGIHKPSHKLVRRQDTQNSTAVPDELNIIIDSVIGISLLAESMASAIEAIAMDLGLDDSDSGANDGQDGGDSSGDPGSTDGSGSGSGDGDDDSDNTPGSTSNQRRETDLPFCKRLGFTDDQCAEILAELENERP